MAARGRTKEALLLVLAVTTLATAVFTFRHAGPPRKARASSPQSAGGQAAAALPGKGDWKPLDPETVMPATNGERNPFTAPAGAPPIRVATAKPGHESEEGMQAPAPNVTRPAVTPPPSFPPLGVAQSQPAGTVQPAGVAPPPPDKPSLSGIVVDSAGKLTAVIHEGDQRYFAKAGDRIAGKYRVQSVSNQQVVLVAARERLILKMGGS